MVREDILQRFGLLAFRLKRTNYLFGDTFGVADRYPFILTGGARRNSGSRSPRAIAITWRASRHAPLCGRRNGVKRFPRLLPRNYEASALKRPNSTARRTTALTERRASPASFPAQAVQTKSLLACASMTPSDSRCSSGSALTVANPASPNQGSGMVLADAGSAGFSMATPPLRSSLSLLTARP